MMTAIAAAGASGIVRDVLPCRDSDISGTGGSAVSEIKEAMREGFYRFKDLCDKGGELTLQELQR